MAEKTTTLSHDSDLGKESPVNTKNYFLESQEVQAADQSEQGSGSGETSKETVIEKKRGRGRPRKHDNSVQNMEDFPPPTSSSLTKRARGRPKGTGKLQALASAAGYLDTAGGSFTPHVLSVHRGEDIVKKIGLFCAKASRSVCVLAANGAVSIVTLCKPASSIGTLTYQGRFEILTLTGSSVISGELGSRRKTGLFSVSLANSHGRVFGGRVAGPLVAAGPGPIQLIVAVFKQNISREIKKKYSEGTSTSANIFASSEIVNDPFQVTGTVDNDNSAPAPATDLVKTDCLKSDNIIAENHDFNPTSPQCVGPNNLKTLPVSVPISAEMTIPNTNSNVPETHEED